MTIYDMKTNGKTDPMGDEFSRLAFSWKAKGESPRPVRRLCVSRNPGFSDVCLFEDGKELDGIAHAVSLELSPRTRYFWKVSDGEGADSPVAFFETGKMDEPWSGRWISTQECDTFHPEFERLFELKKGFANARLYIAGLGLFEAYLNGEKVGDDLLAPFVNDYIDGIQTCTYDVTDMLKADNRLRIILGNGWYKGRFGFEGKKALFGNRFLLKAELRISYADGSEEIIASDASWKYRRSYIKSSDIYDGELQDIYEWNNAENPWINAVETDGPRTLDRYSLPLRAHEVMQVREVVHTPAGEMVLDFGQNFAGYVEYSGVIPSGETLRMQFGEILQEGNFFRDNYRSAKAEFCYRSDGIERTVRPHFTYYGFRYVKVEAACDIHPEDFKGVAVYSDVQRAGSFSSSNKLLDRLYSNTVWSMKSNFIDMPTDCPQRDERLGWTGDAQVFAPTACYHADTKAFFSKYLADLRKDQLRNGGKVAVYLPNFHSGLTSSVWSDIAAILPMHLFRCYGDKELLAENYPLMKDWVECVHAQDAAGGQKDLWNFGFHFGDWLALDGVTPKSERGATDIFFISSAYYYNSAKLTAEAAAILGKDGDAARYGQLAERIKAQILYNYFTPSGRLAIDTQTAYYVSLTFGLYRTKDAVVEGLKKRLKKDCYKIKSGFVGAPVQCIALAEAGLVDIAFDFLFQEDCPGWLYEVKQGATTIWERWNSVLPDGRVSDTGMNSLNHYAYGSVAEFIYRYIGGIQSESPGFRTARIAPNFTPELTWADCSYDSAAGLYRVRWELLENREVRVDVEIPFGAKARIFLPDYEKNGEELTGGKYTFRYKTNRDYTCRYRPDSRLQQMKNDADVLSIAEKCAGLKEILIHGNDEALSQTLEELRQNMFSGVNPQTLDNAIKDILAIKVNRAEEKEM